MVQGLGFLSKKSWHTKNKLVQEKVWVAEERDRQEAQKTAELAKQIQAEREEEHFAKISGQEKKDRGIDWMYNGHLKDSETAKADAEKQNEEYLLGKAFVPNNKSNVVGDLAVSSKESTGVNAIVLDINQRNEPPASLDSVAARNEAFHVRHEDPMFEVSLEKVRQEQELEHRKNLYSKAGLELVKKKKKKPKHKKQKKRKHYDSEEDSYDDRRRRRSSSPDRKRRDRSPDRKRRDRSPDRKKRRSPSYENNHRRRSRGSQSPSYYYNDDRRERRRTSRRSQKSPPPDRHERRKRSPSYDDDDRRPTLSYDRKRDYRSRSRSLDGNRRDNNKKPNQNNRRLDDLDRNTRPPPPPPQHYSHDEGGHSNNRTVGEQRKAAGYGLQGNKAVASLSSTTDLGPDRDLVERKRAQRASERQQQFSQNNKRLTAAEREQAIREMQVNAQDRSCPKPTTIISNEGSSNDQKPSASFLREMKRQQYGL